MNDVPDTVDAVARDAAARLIAAAGNRRLPMHTPVLGTADGDLRIAVLRACDPALAALRFHTDARSPKVAVLRADPAVSLLAYDAGERIQIRARGTARVETSGPAADAAWQAATAFARRCYLAVAAPGTPADAPLSGLPADVEGRDPDEAELIPARANFAIVQVVLTRIDWLNLAHTGHRRAVLTRSGAADAWRGQWVVP